MFDQIIIQKAARIGYSRDPENMYTQNNQATAPEYPGPAVNMDPSSQVSETVTAAEFPSIVSAVPYTDNTAGWNPAILPPPPPYSEVEQPQPVFMPQIIFKTDLSDNPGLAICPACNKQCTTTIEYKSGCLTILLCCLLFFFGCVLGCFLIPCCIKSCKDVNHHCPYCNHLIYKHKRL